MADLNKPAAQPPGLRSDPHRTPRWYLWDGGFAVVGEGGGEVPAHSHHAIQVFVAIGGEAAVRTQDGAWHQGRGIVIRPDVEHSFNAQGCVGALLIVDAESSEGLWLRATLTQDVTVVPDARVEPCIDELRSFWDQPMAALDPADMVRHCVRAFCAGVPPVRKLDRRIARALQAIAAATDLRLSLDDTARLVGLSPDRFAHLFKDQLGLPFRRYILWRKVTRAMLAIGRQCSIAEAAHEADFADAAHLTRTFNEMFGIPPSVMMRGDFFEIEPPFTRTD